MKKMLLVLSMFLFMTNVKALTFNVDLTNIEDKGNNGTIGSIEKIDITNKELDVLFQDIGDEVNFDLTISNTGDRAGNLKEIKVTSQNDKIEYTNNLPETGLAINSNDSNTVTITAKVKEGAVNGKTSSQINVVYRYDVGSCPEGEILTEDESMCLCPEGMERNEEGRCVKPEKKIECKDDEIYNETKKICEKKVTPTPDKKITPINPKTLDNIVIITALFITSALGIFLIFFKKIKSKNKKIVLAVIIGTVTFSLSFSLLASVFGIDNLLGAIVNPITKSKEIVLTVNEEIDLIETWDGECSLDDADLAPETIFEGGSGTESDPYQIKTAEQLSCLAKSANHGTTYEGKYIKQIKNIKLNDHLNEHAEANDLTNAHVWTSIGNDMYSSFNGSYDGDNHIISGLYIDYDDSIYDGVSYAGLFGRVKDSVFKNISLSDVYMNFSESAIYTPDLIGALISYSEGNLTLKNINTSGNINNRLSNTNVKTSGVVSQVNAYNNEILIFENIENNINITAAKGFGIIGDLTSHNSNTDDYVIKMKNLVNNGNFNVESGSGIVGDVSFDYSMINSSEYDNHYFALLDGLVNNGNATLSHFDPENDWSELSFEGIIKGTNRTIIKDTHNTGNITTHTSAKMVGILESGADVLMENCYNSGDLLLDIFNPEGGVSYDDFSDYTTAVGLSFYCFDCEISNSYNTGTIAGALGYSAGLIGDGMLKITNSYNLGDIYGSNNMGGLAADIYTGSIIENSYNKGNIIAWIEDPYYEYNITFIGGLVGGDSSYFDDVTINNCYNEGDISVLAKVSDQNSKIAGIVPYGAVSVKNSYNRGNLYSKYSRIYMCGVACDSSEIVNSYNSGNMTFENNYNIEVEPWWESPIYFGIGDYSEIRNSYNLGNILINDDSGVYGIGGSGATNSVNTGNITININVPFTSQRRLVMYGGDQSGYNESTLYNSGILSIIDKTNTHTVRDPNLNNTVNIGLLNEIDYSNESEDFYSEWTSIVCNLNNTCTLEDSTEIGTYPSIDVPSILSIINGDNAFNDELDEFGLPTLKVFNE